MSPPTTDGTLLGGRLRYRQLAAGHRTGIEPVLLAAAVPARPGETVLEAGTGAGAGLLCLAARVPGVHGMAVELDPTLAALAADNLAANGLSHCQAVAADIAAYRPPAPLHHAFANPPWHTPAATPSPDGRRDLAKRRAPETLASWSAALARALRPRGTLTLIVPAAVLGAAAVALTAAGCGALCIQPFWPKHGRAAKLVLLQARKGARGPDRMLPGISLHEASGAYTDAAQRILRDGAALDLTV